MTREELETIGLASACWENPGGAGTFQSEQALKAGQRVMNAIDEYVNQEKFCRDQ